MSATSERTYWDYDEARWVPSPPPAEAPLGAEVPPQRTAVEAPAEVDVRS